ncbi:MAG: ABC transporter substrate-binding protein [Microthrixaceae bacterium]|nr:ABC transporter substrate-binding protein [Microthrixaceae bacterium]
MPRTTTRTWILIVAVAALLAGACAAKGDENATPETTAAGGSESNTGTPTGGFGDMDSPCGEGDFTVEADEAAGSADVLRIGVANDRTSQIRPGLNKEMWDASNAFAAWCNEQGGIGGLPIEIVDLDGKVLEVEAAMAKACHNVFMMVGGGFVQDNLEFSGKPDSDFHKCALADIPGFAVSPEKAGSNGQIQPVPHPSPLITTSQMQMAQALEPENTESIAIVWGDLPSMETIKNQTVEILEDLDIDNAGVFNHPVVGLDDWTPLAQQVIRSGAGAFHYVGEPTHLGNFVKTLREQGWEGTPIVETNIYDQQYIDAAGGKNAAGTIIRTWFHPFEEADEWPAVKQYMDIVDEYVDDGKIATLGMQSFSAWLLFATAANDCAADNDNVLTRACVLEAAAAVDEWTAGGLHATMDPGPEGGSPRSARCRSP